MSIKSLPFLYFKGRSSLDFNLLIRKKGTYNAPERDVTRTSVAGRSGDLITDNGRYFNINIPYELTLLRKDVRPFHELVLNIKSWLYSETGYFELWDSYDTRYFRLASVSGGLNIEEEVQELGSFTVDFDCKPYRYSFDGQKVSTIRRSGATFTNPELCESKPYIKIYGSGNINLYLNGKTFSFTDISEYIELDSEIMCAYKGLELQNSKMSSDAFPTFAPGSNTITYNGNVNRIEIIPRWCSL